MGQVTSRKLKAYYINLALMCVIFLAVAWLSGENLSGVAIPVATALSMLYGVMVLGNVGEHFAKKDGGRNANTKVRAKR